MPCLTPTQAMRGRSPGSARMLDQLERLAGARLDVFFAGSPVSAAAEVAVLRAVAARAVVLLAGAALLAVVVLAEALLAGALVAGAPSTP